MSLVQEETRARGGRLRAVLVLTAALVSVAAVAAPAALADTTQVEVSGTQLKLTGLPKSPSAVQVSYVRSPDRFLVVDAGGLQPINPECVSDGPTRVLCDATGLMRVDADLGDGDDVFVIDASKAQGVPRRFAVQVTAGKGADVVSGGLGDDTIYGQQGRDVVAGGLGNDFLSGGPSTDAAIGFGGDDILLGDGGRDALFGQKGHDLMFGGTENDVLLARDGERDPKINCGPGKRQRAVDDRRDPPSSNCREPRARDH
jgi:hypothetical protein